MSNLRVVVVALVLFASVSLTSGRIRESGGLGYDGTGYALMVSDGLDAGLANGRLRPLVVFIARAAHLALGTDVITTFVGLNWIFMALLALGLARLMAHYGASESVRMLFVANTALCISTAQMFAYYPVLVDLGAVAVLVLAVYCAVAAPAVVAAVAAVAAVACREFGMAAVIFGVHRQLRLRRPGRAVLTYLPAVITFAGIRFYVTATTSAVGDPEDQMLTAGGLLDNAALWLSPAYVFFFGYFFVTVFGGLSASLVVQYRRVWAFVRREHELLSLLVPIVGLAAIGSADIWRYLVFLLPGAAILFAATLGKAPRLRWTAIAITVLTVVTQHPWRQMTDDLYFAHWFPYYAWLAGESLSGEVVRDWVGRTLLTALGLVLVRGAITAERHALDPSAVYHVRR